VRLLQPITALLLGSQRVAHGDFSKPVPALGWGELDELGKTFNQMSGQVQRYQNLQVERLLEEKAKVDALVSNIPEGVLLVGLDGAVAFANATAADLVLTNASGILLLDAGEALPALELAADIGIAALCAEAVGAMDELVAVTVEYMNTRKQFGVPIASFQALRHRVADVKMQLELARSMSYYATLKLGEAPAARRRALAQAKVQLGQSMRFVGQQCIQLHGGIGVTDEYAAGHYFKRLTVIEMTFGDTMHHLGQVSDRMQDTAGVFA